MHDFKETVMQLVLALAIALAVLGAAVDADYACADEIPMETTVNSWACEIVGFTADDQTLYRRAEAFLLFWLDGVSGYRDKTGDCFAFAAGARVMKFGHVAKDGNMYELVRSGESVLVLLSRPLDPRPMFWVL